MKIDKPGKPLPPPASNTGATARPHTGRPSSAAGQTSGAPAETSVHLGASSQNLQDVEASMAGAPLVNAAKIAEIRQAISEGRFRVNTGVVADRLIETVKDLIKTQKR